ncbi:hypothetical protein [Haliangium sp.]|uniref:hypothetical protein n=1 Tax=Haliangium sp. TaxID=2663208 RepID=UPI003D0A9FD7
MADPPQDTSRIHALIARARRRLRLQAALETATTASILAVGAAVVVVWLLRRELIPTATGVWFLAGCGGLVLAGAALGALRRLPTHLVATRIDRASDLSGRLATACAFEGQLGRGQGPSDPHTRALMDAAIRDAVAAAPRADVKAATPFAAPRDGRAALAFVIVGLAVAGLTVPAPIPPDADGGLASLGGTNPTIEVDKDHFIEEDIDYTKDLLEDLRRVAQEERDPNLQAFVNEIETLVAQAELGELSKEELLEKLAQAEEHFMQGAGEDIEQTMADLEETGQTLKQSPLMRELAKALEQGDLETAQQELEKLAQKLDSGDVSDQDVEKMAKALEQAAQKFEQKDAKRDQELAQKIDKAKKELRRLQRERDQTQDPQKKERITRRLERKQRELKRLERQKEERQASQQRRTLKRLHRNLDKAAQDMKKSRERQDPNQQDQQQERQRMASRSLRDAAKDTGKVDADRRKLNTQKKVASQLDDLREAMRRARQRQSQGPKDLFGKNQRNRDFERRAQGQQGSRGAWRPGQRSGQRSGRISQGRQGQGQQPGQQGQQPGQQGQQGGQGQQPGGDSYGDQHDPNVLGDPTKRIGQTNDESVSGLHGRGPSRRETILSAAQKGFASRAYERVYADYKNIVEEVIRAEKVPSGYKYYVKRYFQKIKPHSMD